MGAILPNIAIDSDATLARYFLPYQLMWIADDSVMRLAEKSVRIGWTYCDAFKNVRKRLRNKDRDYLFATKDQQSALEYLDSCKKFAELFDYTRSIVSHGMDDMKVEAIGEDGKKFTQEIKFGYIKFDNGSRIIAFSANPYAMAVFGGDVGLDEFAKHQNQEKLWETAQGRITWGFDIGVWSAHDGTDTLFYQFAKEAAAGKGGWSHYRVTMEDAVEMGLVEKINSVSGKEQTREQFIQDCKNRARLPEIYEQAYNCNPSGSASAIVPWQSIQNCRVDRKIERMHLEAGQISEMFGGFDRSTEKAREIKIQEFTKATFANVFNSPQLYRLGFDVAASGQGDLACIYIDRKETSQKKLDALFTCRTSDWDFLETVLWTFLRNLSAVQACGDETGLGRQICWRSNARFPGQFQGVNFSSSKHDMGHTIMNELSTAEKILPLDHDDIAQDFFAMRKVFSGGKWKFLEGRNNLNPNSHCDMAWAGALASKADGNSSGGTITDPATIRMGGGYLPRTLFTPAKLG
jgi:phage FluMu gp28-like protein